MKKLLIDFSIKQKFLLFGILLFSISNSVLIDNQIGIISILFLIFYFLISLRQKNSHRIALAAALVLLVLAVIIFILDTYEELYVPIKKLSEWVYLLMVVGLLQMIFPNKNERK